MSNLADNTKYFDKVVPKDQDFDSKNYVGIFRFRFWSTQSQNPGEWIEVVIDDRLPTKDRQLIYALSNFEAGSDDPNKQKQFTRKNEKGINQALYMNLIGFSLV